MTMVTADAAELAALAARYFASAVEKAVEERGRFVVALAGGTTPRSLYQALAGEAYRDLPWSSVHVYWGDERDVPLDHADSNYRMAREALLDHVPIPAENIHPFPIETTPPKEAAQAYERTLRAQFGPDAEWPTLDLVLLGLGNDVHTASLFPGSAALDEAVAWVAAPHIAKLSARRYTLTIPALAHAREMLFLVSGEGKAEAVRKALEGEPGDKNLPAQRVSEAHGKAVWLLDKPASRRLKDV